MLNCVWCDFIFVLAGVVYLVVAGEEQFCKDRFNRYPLGNILHEVASPLVFSTYHYPFERRVQCFYERPNKVCNLVVLKFHHPNLNIDEYFEF